MVVLRYANCGGLNITTARCPAQVLLRQPIYINSARVPHRNRGLSAKLLGAV